MEGFARRFASSPSLHQSPILLNGSHTGSTFRRRGRKGQDPGDSQALPTRSPPLLSAIHSNPQLDFSLCIGQAKYTDTVAAVKDLIERRTNLGRAVNLVFRGAVLDDDKQLSQTALRDGDLLIATTTTSSDTTASTAPRDADTDPRPRPSKRCAACGVAVGLVAQQMRCRCSQVFCDKHRRPEQHQCPVDAGLAQKERLRAQVCFTRTHEATDTRLVVLRSADLWHWCTTVDAGNDTKRCSRLARGESRPEDRQEVARGRLVRCVCWAHEG